MMVSHETLRKFFLVLLLQGGFHDDDQSKRATGDRLTLMGNTISSYSWNGASCKYTIAARSRVNQGRSDIKIQLDAVLRYSNYNIGFRTEAQDQKNSKTGLVLTDGCLCPQRLMRFISIITQIIIDKSCFCNGIEYSNPDSPFEECPRVKPPSRFIYIS